MGGTAGVRIDPERELVPPEPEAFTPLPGRGLLGTLDGQRWAVGNRRQSNTSAARHNPPMADTPR